MAEPASLDEPLPFDDAAELLHAFRTGVAGDHLIPDPPLLIVQLDDARTSGPGTVQPLRPPTQWPCVVVAVDRSSGSPSPGPPPAGADIYLSGAPNPPAPWVSSDDLDGLIAAVGANPQASTTLVQVLRSSSAEVEQGLVTESLAYASLQAGREHRDWLEANRGLRRPDTDDSPAVRATRSGGALDVVLDRPARRNAYSARMRDDLVAALQLAASEPAITQVHLSGHGPSFCSGGDLAEFGSVGDPAAAHQIRMTRNAGWLANLVSAKLTAHVHGSCVGAGVELPAFAGCLTAAPDTTLRLPEVSMGLIPGAGGTVSIPRRVGRSRAAWLAISGKALDAETGLSWGLVDSIRKV